MLSRQEIVVSNLGKPVHVGFRKISSDESSTRPAVFDQLDWRLHENTIVFSLKTSSNVPVQKPFNAF